MTTPPPVSGWARGGITFAGVLLLLVGSFQVISGVVAVLDDDFYVVAQNYTFDLDTDTWGWVHLLIGVMLAITGAAVLKRRPWAQATAVCLAMLSALANFVFIPYYPIWATLLIALDVWIIWALTRPGTFET